MPEKLAILGAGSWGMAVARLLANKGESVILWHKDELTCHKLRTLRRNPEKLPDCDLPESIAITHSLEEAVCNCDLVLLTVPAQSVRSVISQSRRYFNSLTGIVNLAKGIETRTLKRLSEVITEELESRHFPVAVVSGPSHAEEVALDLPTAVVAAGTDERFVTHIQQLLSTSCFRVYRSSDLIGVELGGALKNIIAIAAGIADGLGLGDNSKGAIITRGLAEITRLGIAFGARPETFAGLSGLGDLVTTCTSRYSRNRYVGEKVGQGKQLNEVLSGMNMVAEGVTTTQAASETAKKHNIDMPITREVYSVLFEGRDPSAAVEELMDRTLKSEIWS